jgi:hypothetical protein
VIDEKAREIAQNVFGGHPAAAPLMLEALHGQTPDRRERSRLALRLLDLDEPVHYFNLLGPSWWAALAIAHLLVANVSERRRDRHRIAGLLAALCREASRLQSEENAA